MVLSTLVSESIQLLLLVTTSFTFTGPTALYLWVGSLLVEPVLLFGSPNVQAYVKLASVPSVILELPINVPLPSGKQMLGKLKAGLGNGFTFTSCVLSTETQPLSVVTFRDTAYVLLVSNTLEKTAPVVLEDLVPSPKSQAQVTMLL